MIGILSLQTYLSIPVKQQRSRRGCVFFPRGPGASRATYTQPVSAWLVGLLDSIQQLPRGPGASRATYTQPVSAWLVGLLDSSSSFLTMLFCSKYLSVTLSDKLNSNMKSNLSLVTLDRGQYRKI